MASYCYRCHVCDDEESHQEDHVEGDHVHDDHDGHCCASGSEDCLVMCSLFHSTLCWHSVCSSVFDGVASSSLLGFYDLVLVSVGSPSCRSSHEIPVLTCYSVKFFHVGLQCILVRACAFDTSRPRGSAPRSFRNYGSPWSPSNLSFFYVFVILQSVHDIDTFVYSSMRFFELQGRT